MPISQLNLDRKDRPLRKMISDSAWRSSFPSPASLVISNTQKRIPPVRRRLRTLPYAKLYNGILCQLVN